MKCARNFFLSIFLILLLLQHYCLSNCSRLRFLPYHLITVQIFNEKRKKIHYNCKTEYPGPSERHEPSVLAPVGGIYIEEASGHDEDPDREVDSV